MPARKMNRWGDRWKGADVVVMASGPSLTVGDIETVQQWREAGDNRYVIVTNTTYKWAMWADCLVFHDFKWWKKYGHDVVANFKGERVTISTSVNSSLVTVMPRPGFDSYGNSGAMAINLAVLAGAKRIITLGLDCQYTNGKRHHFGNHPPELGNARSLGKWPASFKRLAGHAKGKGVEVLNASRATALDCFERVSLEDVL
jgi:hypothetical protein